MNLDDWVNKELGSITKEGSKGKKVSKKDPKNPFPSKPVRRLNKEHQNPSSNEEVKQKPPEPEEIPMAFKRKPLGDRKKKLKFSDNPEEQPQIIKKSSKPKIQNQEDNNPLGVSNPLPNEDNKEDAVMNLHPVKLKKKFKVKDTQIKINEDEKINPTQPEPVEEKPKKPTLDPSKLKFIKKSAKRGFKYKIDPQAPASINSSQTNPPPPENFPMKPAIYENAPKLSQKNEAAIIDKIANAKKAEKEANDDDDYKDDFEDEEVINNIQMAMKKENIAAQQYAAGHKCNNLLKYSGYKEDW